MDGFAKFRVAYFWHNNTFFMKFEHFLSSFPLRSLLSSLKHKFCFIKIIFNANYSS